MGRSRAVLGREDRLTRRRRRRFDEYRDSRRREHRARERRAARRCAGIGSRCGRHRAKARRRWVRDFTLGFSGATTGSAVVHAEADVGAAIEGAQVVVISVPAYGHKAVMDAARAAPHRRAPRVRDADAVAHVAVPVETPARARRRRADRELRHDGDDRAQERPRGSPAAVDPQQARPRRVAGALHRRGECASPPRSTASVSTRRATRWRSSMVNVNPVSHVPLALANLTRIERGEVWTQYDNMAGARREDDRSGGSRTPERRGGVGSRRCAASRSTFTTRSVCRWPTSAPSRSPCTTVSAARPGRYRCRRVTLPRTCRTGSRSTRRWAA